MNHVTYKTCRTYKIGVVFVFLFIVYCFWFLAPLALAQTPSAFPAPGQETVQDAAALPEQAGIALASPDPRLIVARIIRVGLSFIGIVVVVIIIYAGFLWMTSAGNEEQITRARRILINAVIGLAIILSALGIVQFVINSLIRATTAPPLPATARPAARVGGGALGSGIVESHFPMRDARNVARNTRIIVTFKEPIDPASIAASSAQDEQGRPKFFDAFDDNGDGAIDRRVPVDGLTLRADAVQIIRGSDVGDSARDSDAAKYLGSQATDAEPVDVLVRFTDDLHTFIFTPVDRNDHAARALLGSSDAPTFYRVYLCGTAPRRGNCQEGGIKLQVGGPAFQGRFNDYEWSFETGVFLDVTPPRIQNVIPQPDNAQDAVSGGCPSGVCHRRDQPRNIMVQVNFSEAILPTVASGTTVIAGNPTASSGPELNPAGYQIMQVYTGSGGGRVFYAGTWQIGNQYQAAEFTPTELCARNSCGENVYCLPGKENVIVDILAAEIPPQGGPASAGLFDGIEDVAGNSLDGNENARAEGPKAFFSRNIHSAGASGAPGDNARFSFWTSDEVVLGAPVILATTPETTYRAPTAGVPLSANPLSVLFSRAMSAASISSKNMMISGLDTVTGGLWDTWWTTGSVNSGEDPARPLGQTQAQIRHGGLWEKTNYTTSVSSRVRDLYQNCYYPSGGEGIRSGEATVVCVPDENKPYCCNGVICAAGEPACQVCGFEYD